MRIKYTAGCDCGGVFSATELDLSQGPGDVVTIDLDMMGDMVLECPGCGDRVFLPSVADSMVEADQ